MGLGNPGPTYAGNRHNVGAMVVDAMAADAGAKLSNHRSQALVAQIPGLVLARPMTYMNESGGPVAGLVRYFHVSTDQVLVIHDELDLPFGQLRLKRGGGEGGHNGLRSISKSLGTQDYCRLRIGIGRPPGRMNPVDFVLHDFAPAERPDVAVAIQAAADVVDQVRSAGFAQAQNRVNSQR